MIAHWLITVASAALAARLLVYCWRTIRSEHRYTARSQQRRQRSRQDIYWAIYRADEAETARQLQLARLRAESFNHGLHSVKT